MFASPYKVIFKRCSDYPALEVKVEIKIKILKNSGAVLRLFAKGSQVSSWMWIVKNGSKFFKVSLHNYACLLKALVHVVDSDEVILASYSGVLRLFAKGSHISSWMRRVRNGSKFFKDSQHVQTISIFGPLLTIYPASLHGTCPNLFDL